MWRIDWTKNNKVAIRNCNVATDLHDLVKMLLVRMLRRKHPYDPIYTEYAVAGGIPDIVLLTFENKEPTVMVWEIQKNLSQDWEEQILKRYKNQNLTIVPLIEIENKMLKNKGRWLETLRSILDEYVV